MRKKPDIPFSQDSARFFVPWISMLMVFIATLVLSLGMVAYSSVEQWHRGLSGSMTIQIPAFDEDGHDRGDAVTADIETTLTILRSSDGILGATVLTKEQMDKLMAPWIGEKADTTQLPLPKLIDVTLDPAREANIEQIKMDLAEQVPTAIVDSHRVLLSDLVELTNSVVKLAALILSLLLVTTAFSIMYATKTSLSVHQPVIALIHMMGAGDYYITGQYAKRSFKLTLIGSLIGFILALPIMALFGFFIENMASGFVLKTALTYMQWGGLVAIPFIAAGLAFLTTFKTVLHELKQYI